MHSIRNSIEGTVQRITSDKVMSEVILSTPVGPIVAVITTASVKAMKIKKRDVLSAQIKATNISLARCTCGQHNAPPRKGRS